MTTKFNVLAQIAQRHCCLWRVHRGYVEPVPSVPHCQFSCVLPLATRFQDSGQFYERVELEQVSIFKCNFVQGYKLVHIITVIPAFDCAA